MSEQSECDALEEKNINGLMASFIAAITECGNAQHGLTALGITGMCYLVGSTETPEAGTALFEDWVKSLRHTLIKMLAQKYPGSSERFAVAAAKLTEAMREDGLISDETAHAHGLVEMRDKANEIIARHRG